MEILLNRIDRSIHSTISEIFVDGAYECFALEDVDRGLKSDMPLDEIKERKLKGDTAIPEGRYQVIITHSNRFNRELPLLVNVPGYDGIRMHPGNTDKNTAGCVLPGTTKGTDIVNNSKIAFEKLNKKIARALANRQQVWITIKR